jgi:hypothetical protein
MANTLLQAKLPCFYMPYAENSRFTGRDDCLEQVRQTLPPADRRSQASLVLHGLGGVGKTDIALHFVYDSQK